MRLRVESAEKTVLAPAGDFAFALKRLCNKTRRRNACAAKPGEETPGNGFANFYSRLKEESPVEGEELPGLFMKKIIL